MRSSSHRSICILSVIGESTIGCLIGEQTGNFQHDIGKLHDLIDFWGALRLKFLYPNELVADACSKLVERYRKGLIGILGSEILTLFIWAMP